MTLPFAIAGRAIGDSAPPYVIAEVSANHNGRIETALRLIREAKLAGADAVKLQTYTPDTITVKSDAPDFRINGGLWDGRTLYDLYQQAHTPWEWHARLFECARDVGITIFSSPFDPTAVDLLEELGAPAYKIASFELVDLPLIRSVARTGKPMIMSTGMADASEIQEAVDAAAASGCKDIALLHCVSGYPAPASDYNLLTIPDMIRRVGRVTGLSDHTLDNTTAIAGVTLGAALVEKHFTLDRRGGGPDDSFSLEPEQLRTLCCDLRTAWEALGGVNYARKSSEQSNVQFRRSLYFVEDLHQVDVIPAHSIGSIMPWFGLAPKHFEQVVGKRATRAIRAPAPVRPEDFQ